MPLRHTILTSIARVLLLASVMLTIAGAPAAAQTPTTAPDQLLPVLPAWHDDLAVTVADAAAAYTIDADVVLPNGDTTVPQVRGTVTVTWTNPTAGTIDTLPFRLYANGPAQNRTAMQITSVSRDGTPVAIAASDDTTTFVVPLDPALAPGERTTIMLNYTLDMPVDSREQYGILNISTANNTWALAQWYPVIAGLDPARGWVLDPPSVNGDPIFSDIATYDVTVRAPAAWRVISTGVAVDSTDEGSATAHRIVTGPVRDVTLVLDNDFASVQREVDGTTITSWYQPGQERVGEAVLTYAAQALAYFNEVIGPYPYTTLDVVPVELFGAAGVEFPQLIYIGASYYRDTYDLTVPNGLDFTVAHEVLHQWWYGLVGNNQYDHAFIDEGLTNFMSSQLYFTAMYGPAAGATMTQRYLETPFESHNRAAPDVVVDTPTDAFPSGSDYSYAAYEKAPLGFRAIYEQIGPEAFAAAVQRYYADFRFATATPDDLLAAFEAASGQNLRELWDFWFEEANGA